MGTFETVQDMPTEGAIRGLTGEAVEEANRAIQDGLVRRCPATEANDKLVGAIKRYLSQEGWGCKVRTVKGVIHWQVVEKKEITPEHKAKMLAALEAARTKREAEKTAKGSDAPQAPAEKPAAPVEKGAAKKAS